MSDDPLALMAEVLRHEAGAVLALADSLGTQAAALRRVVALLLERCGEDKPGRVLCSGVGKAGLVGRKIAATLASTGTPAYFMHPTEARHGDLGMVRREDVALLLSNSGNTEELLALLPSLKLVGLPLVAVLGRTDSPLARHADCVLSIGQPGEACPLGLAPSTTTTAMLALGDALALSVQRLRRFTPEQYARFHPGGSLGRKLLTCAEVMRQGERVPRVAVSATVASALHAITRARAGSALVVDDPAAQTPKLLGIFTDGDLRRALGAAANAAAAGKVLEGQVGALATMPCKRVRGDDLLERALHLCAAMKINELPVVDAADGLLGLIDLQDLVDRGYAAAP